MPVSRSLITVKSLGIWETNDCGLARAGVGTEACKTRLAATSPCNPFPTPYFTYRSAPSLDPKPPEDPEQPPPPEHPPAAHGELLTATPRQQSLAVKLYIPTSVPENLQPN